MSACFARSLAHSLTSLLLDPPDLESSLNMARDLSWFTRSLSDLQTQTVHAAACSTQRLKPLARPTHLEKGSLRLGGENMVLDGFSTMFTITVWAELFFWALGGLVSRTGLGAP